MLKYIALWSAPPVPHGSMVLMCFQGLREMARSFDCVDFKLMEADFYLEKMRTAGPGYFDINCYLSAYVSAARSVTLALQAVMKEVPEFRSWYEPWQAQLKNNELARKFLEYRNAMLHTGELPIRSGSFERGEDGAPVARHYFGDNSDPFYEGAETDVVSLATTHLTTIVSMISDCYVKLGHVVDPEKYYTLENLERLQMSIEDVEESFGLPRGWTKTNSESLAIVGLVGLSEREIGQERIKLLRRQAPGSQAKWLFEKYLGD